MSHLRGQRFSLRLKYQLQHETEHKWEKHTFGLSEHIHVNEMLKWHRKLNETTLQMLLNCASGFQTKKLGTKLVPQQSYMWLKKCVSKTYSTLQVKCLQSKAFDDDSDYNISNNGNKAVKDGILIIVTITGPPLSSLQMVIYISFIVI